MIYKEGFVRLYKELVARRDDLQAELKGLPEEDLYVNEKNGTRCYYKRLPKKGNRKKERRTGIKSDPELLNALVRKKYVTEALKRLDIDITAVDKMLLKYVPADENSVMEDFVSKYPELADGIYRVVRDKSGQATLMDAKTPFHEENLTSTAADGTPRRSRGELLIGSKLDRHEIPYRYEALAHPDLPFRPDFTIVRPKDGKIIFWEHLGMVNDADYMEGNRRKFAAYEDVGIVPWDNLIITYDQSDGGINERLIDAMVQGWLL